MDFSIAWFSLQSFPGTLHITSGIINKLISWSRMQIIILTWLEVVDQCSLVYTYKHDCVISEGLVTMLLETHLLWWSSTDPQPPAAARDAPKYLQQYTLPHCDSTQSCVAGVTLYTPLTMWMCISNSSTKSAKRAKQGTRYVEKNPSQDQMQCR